MPTQLLATTRGPIGLRYAITQRFPAGQQPPVTGGSDTTVIAGQPVHLVVTDEGEGEARWLLPDGSEAYVRSRGLNGEELRGLVAALSPRPQSAPIAAFNLTDPDRTGFEIIDETANLHGDWIVTRCQFADGETVSVLLLRGDPVFQYGVALDRPTPPEITVRGDTVMISGAPPSQARAAVASLTDTDPEHWNTLLESQGPSPELPAT
ncbi:MAG: hypothetical protein GY925_03460 [Actinomycetia bacterium]|nr:hypothetical protein [Actinomycetes bacterium]